MDAAVEDFLVTDPITGGRTRFGETVRRALDAMSAARVPFSVIGATALAARGFPRMTVDLDLVVLAESGPAAMAALRAAAAEEPEPRVLPQGSNFALPVTSSRPA